MIASEEMCVLPRNTKSLIEAWDLDGFGIACGLWEQPKGPCIPDLRSKALHSSEFSPTYQCGCPQSQPALFNMRCHWQH